MFAIVPQRLASATGSKRGSQRRRCYTRRRHPHLCVEGTTTRLAVHYFPVSQDINSDPEVWELTDRFGDRSLRVWLEILSIADRNNGVLPGPWKDYPSILAGRCKSTTKHVRVVCQWVARWLAIDSQGVARVRNYSKYHKTRAELNTSPNPPILSEPSEPYKNAPSVNSTNVEVVKEKPKGLDPEIKKWADQIYAIDKKKFARLITWIKGANRTYSPVVIALALERFLPYARTVDNGWWGYLDKILDKEEGKHNGSIAAAESDWHKEELTDLAKSVFRGTVIGIAKG